MALKSVRAKMRVERANTTNSVINFVLNSKNAYYSPLKEFFPESDVQQGLEFLFSLETISIPNETVSGYDLTEIEKFKESIKIKDEKFHVNISWNNDFMKKVLSNFSLCKTIAKKFSFNNSKLNVDSKYFEIFKEQLELGIIQQIQPDNPERHVWVPHTPALRDDPLVMTKIRPVFNCSLKIKGQPSLNEAAYDGVDLMADMFGLLQYFRSNSYILLADISKAFLNIKLNRSPDMFQFYFVFYYDPLYTLCLPLYTELYYPALR